MPTSTGFEAPRATPIQRRHKPFETTFKGAAIRFLVATFFLALIDPRGSCDAAAGWEILQAQSSETAYDPGRILVKFQSRLDDNFKATAPLQQLLGEGLQHARCLARMHPDDAPLPGGIDRLYEIPVPHGSEIPALVRKLSRLGFVEYAEPLYLYSLVEEPGVHHLLASPDDPAYGALSQEYLSPMQLEGAWDVIKGEANAPVVCVVDGGTNWEHEDLNANMWMNPGEIPDNGVDDDGNGYVDDLHGWNFRSNSGNVRGDPSQTPSNANHGTHTGGILAAVTNNGIGIASASWNPRLMAVNASANNDGSIAYGYIGIVYAAQNGADIVSLSWGGNSSSQALQDVIDFAIAQGVLVIAAAGNNNTDVPFFPAAYRGVTAVANVWGHSIEGIPASIPDTRYGGSSGSCYGGWLDVAAPGAAIYSTFDLGATNQYGSSTGTSMSAPMAAAVAALIQSKNPTWGPLKVGEQLRITCDDINALNPGFEDRLGKGRVNALRAVTESSPAVRIVDWTLDDADGNGELNQGETVVLSLDVHNYLAGVNAPTFTLSSDSPYVNITDASEDLARQLPEDADASLPSAFTFEVSASAPPGTRLELRVDINASGYGDFQFLPIVLEPVFETHDVNNLEVSLTSTGNIGWVGFAGGMNGEKGAGFRFMGGNNLLFEGALLVGTGPGTLSDAARVSREHTDFLTTNNAPPTLLSPGSQADQEIIASYTDALNSSTPLGVRIDFESFAYAAPPNDDFVLLCYQITNTSTTTFDNLRVGLWFDWDIDENHYSSNRAGYDATRRLGYAWDQPNGAGVPTAGLPFVGVMALGGVEASYSAIRNDGFNQPVSIYNGFSKDDKWLILNGGTGVLLAGPTDISNAIATGPYLLGPGENARVCFALLAGDDLADLQANADLAASLFGDIETSVVDGPPIVDEVPRASLLLGPAVPNPFNPITRLELQVDRLRRLEVSIYDIRGRRVRTLLEGDLQANRYLLDWDGTNEARERVPSGVYFARLKAPGVDQVRRLVLTK